MNKELRSALTQVIDFAYRGGGVQAQPACLRLQELIGKLVPEDEPKENE